ncbi:MAG: Asp-tRNA(Asn)/Glu-tRNA(Gln) amidotransferase subunit GatA, partial [Chitinivibrionales bacterium]|nr:Asp-tRNA(Asn)/Glu-tRNA(Gln) amidotransferase subunit GatA [Chitinivibrionales bacterium]
MRFHKDSIETLAQKIYSGELRSTDLVSTSLDTIKQTSKTNAFTSVLEERSLERAAQIDHLTMKEKGTLPLCGIPVAVKDNICTSGIPTTCASKMLENFVPPYNATVVDALEKAGAVIIGKTNLDEFAMGSSTEISHFGPARNPHNPNYITGGSSGGSAAAVADGAVPAALGSDTGGSIRQPCSHCGVMGLKPTYGRVSRYGLVAFASSLDQIGPIATNVRDIGLVLSIISCPEPRDSTCSGNQFVYDKSLFEEKPQTLRVGIPREYFGEGLSDEVRNACTELIDKLKDKGIQFTEVSLPNLHYAISTYYVICTAEASSNLARYDGVKYGFRAENAGSLYDMYAETRRQGFGPEVKRRIMLGTYVLSSGYYDAYYLKAAKVRTLVSRDFDNAFSSCDAVISPVAPTPAFKIGEKCNDPLQMYLTDI